MALIDAVMAVVATAPRAVILGGGGYNPWTLARAWTALWGRMSRGDVRSVLTVEARAVLARLDCDLVETEDRDPQWLSTLWDARRDGPVRDEIHAIAAASLA